MLSIGRLFLLPLFVGSHIMYRVNQQKGTGKSVYCIFRNTIDSDSIFYNKSFQKTQNHMQDKTYVVQRKVLFAKRAFVALWILL